MAPAFIGMSQPVQQLPSFVLFASQKIQEKSQVHSPSPSRQSLDCSEEAGWEVIPRPSSLVLVETTQTLPQTLITHRFSVSLSSPNLHFCNPEPHHETEELAWQTVIVMSELYCRRCLELQDISEWLVSLSQSAVPFMQDQVRLWNSTVTALLTEEESARLAIETDSSHSFSHLTSLMHCEAKEYAAREALMMKAAIRLEDVMDACHWEILSPQTVRFCVQWEQMLVTMINTLTAVEEYHRYTMEEEQKRQRTELKQEQAAHRRLMVMKRRYPNAPEVLGTETPMHAMLRRYRFPAIVDAVAEVETYFTEVGDDKRPCDSWDGASFASQCMTPEVGTPVSDRAACLPLEPGH